MNKIINIEPINIPKKGIGVYMDIKLAPYQLYDDSLKGYIYIKDGENHRIKTTKFEAPKEIVESWGIEDQYICQYCADAVAVTITSIEDAPEEQKVPKESIYQILRKKRLQRING